ncbi:DUF982 domain-containing protein [Mesorhizobium sp. CU2]|uniref:DUF982 domain-containing protein n=1 Tax=unclassified Mesorhizobium TaxID=325217 RepID=UPI0011269D81|nr:MULTISPECIES: DUF982 domain-containing protein [unclassified Mesorhizobium]TPN76751.1 DUF982 domain-containing protein [Mesorhizobium sp. CU3]TPO11744.1 DUF982 domain-containing protein [Mesorhizobium sp. CU2]
MKLQTPVAVTVGAGFKREIASLGEMQNFLKEWPAMRGENYAAALQACEAARSGQTNLGEVRRAFLVFAKQAGIVWTGADPVAVLREAKLRRVRTRQSQARH